MRSLNCVQRSDKALAAGAMGSFLLRSPQAWAAGGVGAAVGLDLEGGVGTFKRP